ncbi:hypothetical protein L207DRAFT_236541 [Hyaloscypha variabilis F]|uniref:Uncharacterized protein n=1 Tax=Hyaloscypha variabilis (strain UAMH 11265 / GT02V1 / F) TaxID=1149755 RepID=A0A2J6QTB0_HYAVF|nr:hypothetical protein L207DRAFT_236541 [Hyaloscypha variabilis F]
MPTALLHLAQPWTARLEASLSHPMLSYSMSTMPRQQNLQHSGFAPYPPPIYPSSTDSDSLDSMSTEAHPQHDFGDQHHSNNNNSSSTADEHFFVGELDLEHLDPWRRNVPSPMPRITDAITQGTFYGALLCSALLLLCSCSYFCPSSCFCTFPVSTPQFTSHNPSSPQLLSPRPLSPIRSAPSASLVAARRAWL